MGEGPGSDTPASTSELSEEERKRIRAEMRYAMLAAHEARPSERPKSLAEKAFGYLSNGFVLLLIGSLITAVLVPHFQRKYENRIQQSTLKKESLSQFLLYSNSIWQEYYAILPLTLQPEIDRKEYLQYMNEISQIKLKRYDAYAKVEALAVVFREGATERSPVETALGDYAIKVNAVSEAIDKLPSIKVMPPSVKRVEFGDLEGMNELFASFGLAMMIGVFWKHRST